MRNEKQIFPKEVIENSVEKHFAEYNAYSSAVYLTLLALFAIAFLLLFIVRVDVTIRSQGIIRPVQERTDIRVPVDGIVDSVFIAENQHVVAGQPLVKIHSQAVDKQQAAMSSQRAELNARHADLRLLLAGDGGAPQGQLYRQQQALYRQRLSDARLRLALVSKEYKRFAELFRSRAISAAEFDKYDYELKHAQADLRLVQGQQRSQWQADLSQLEIQLEQLGAQQAAIEDAQAMYMLRAGVTGTVQRLEQISRGTFVSPSEAIGEISPDSGLVAEVYVSTRDIGLLHPGMPLKMQVDAYDYNIWGVAKGRIASISGDVFTDRAKPYFRVMCMLDSRLMRMRNGAEGALKKGMTVQARFVVARRSLFQLLYDDVSDWINPNVARGNEH